MVLEFNQVNEILRRQPVGYYLGRAVKVSLKNTKNSYYSLSTDEIVISYPRIVLCFEELIKQGATLDTNTAVRMIRTILYHELGHTMLTPKESVEFFKWYSDIERGVINVVEDERIEWLLDGFIKNVNFKELLSLANKQGECKNVFERFFDLVRFNVYEAGWSERVDNLLEKYSGITYKSDYWDSKYYLNSIIDLWNDYKDAHEDEYENQEDHQDNNYSNPPFSGMNGSGDSSSNSPDNNSNSSDSNNQNGNGDNDSNTSSSPSNGSNSPEEQQQEIQDKFDELERQLSDGNAEEGISNEMRELLNELLENLDISDEDSANFDDAIDKAASEEITDNGLPEKRSVGPDCKSTPKIFKECAEAFINDKLYQELTRIFNSVNKVHKMNSSAVNTYSGVIDPRSAGRDDYKFFVQRNRGGNNKAYSKVHLNLFLDRSGSFCNNQDTANQIIHTLTKIEKMNPNFDYTFITVGEFPRIEDKKNIYYIADGGNDMTPELYEVFKKVQVKSAINYNLVLFDGLACCGWSGNAVNWGAFNTDNTLIISDPNNERHIERYCNRARSIITTNYTSELIDNIIKVLSSIVR